MRGGGGRYSPGASSALTQIVPYFSSLYTVFHSVIYNSVLIVQSFPKFVNSALLRRVQLCAVFYSAESFISQIISMETKFFCKTNLFGLYQEPTWVRFEK